MEKETEIKFKVDKSFLSKIKYIKLTPYNEEDEYFFTQKMIDEDTYLRFRKKKGKILLNLKDITKGTSQTKDCYEADELDVEVTPEQYKTMKKIFEVTFPVRIKVKKIRHKGLFDGCEICYDNVKGLGFFLEIEGEREKILKLCKQFGLNLKNRDMESGYAKMTLKKEGFI
jgi:adenylate cyclase class IV